MSAVTIVWTLLVLVVGLVVAGVLYHVGNVLFVACRWVYRWVRIAMAKGVRRARLLHAQQIRRWWKRDCKSLGLVHTYQRERRDGHVQTVTVKPKIVAAAEPWGVRVRMGTVPGVGITEVERHATHLADCWRAESIEVERMRHGTVEMRVIDGDLIAEHRPYPWPTDRDAWVLPIGHNAWGEPVVISLPDVPGVKVGGLSGFGKTVLLSGWAAGFADRPEVQFVVLDGKTRNPTLGDWSILDGRAMAMVGDDPEQANAQLVQLVELVKSRPERLRAERGTHKFWTHGPTTDNPLVVVVLDEAHNYVDIAGTSRADREVIEANQRHIRTLVKEGRSTGVVSIPATQKATADALPTAIRDNLPVGVCFATSTPEAAEAVLGAGIRADEPNLPTNLRDKTRYQGVCVVTGLPGLDGRYARVRVGDIHDDELTARLADTAHLRRDLADLIGPPRHLEVVA
ncbi:MAG: hypothetical protein ACRDPQ_09610 [Nocardioidaceae bacterium]